MRIEHLLAAHALRTPDKTAIVTGPQRITFGDLNTSAHTLAGGLYQAGVRPGDRVLIYLPNGVEFVQLMCAAFVLGALAVPVNTRLTPKELSYFAEDCQPSLIAYHSDSIAALEPVAEKLRNMRHLVLGNAPAGALGFDDLFTHTDQSLPEVGLDQEDAMIMYSSGTTGKPKGALITHANLVIQHGMLNAVHWGLSASDTYLVTTPISHRTGLARTMNALCLGGTVIAMERFDPQATLQLIATERVTVMGIVPTVARIMLPYLEKDPQSCATLRHIAATGEAFPVELKRRLNELLPQVKLHSFFGMTEGGGVTSLSGDEQFTHPDSVGRPAPGVQVKLVDDSGAEVPVGTVGEMLVRSGAPGRYTTMRGYYNRPEANAETIVDGWIKTGDMARFDADGYLYIVDRKKDMVLSGGYNIYTKEVEQALLENPAVGDAAVVGVPDPLYGEAVAAFIEIKQGHKLTKDEVVEHVRSRIAGYKKPKYVYFVDTLPRNALGKVLKNELRQMADRLVANMG